jgi:hypothetical protein
VLAEPEEDECYDSSNIGDGKVRGLEERKILLPLEPSCREIQMPMIKSSNLECLDLETMSIPKFVWEEA